MALLRILWPPEKNLADGYVYFKLFYFILVLNTNTFVDVDLLQI